MNKLPYKKSPVMIATILFIILSGCGGGSSDSSPPAPTPNPAPSPSPAPVPSPTSWNVDVRDGTTINKDNLYVVQNTNDQSSMVLAKEYATKRNIPTSHILNVALPVQKNITATQAQILTTTLSTATDAKGFALAWSQPYRVGSNQSITSFVANGAVPDSTFTTTCNVTPFSTYYSTGPYKTDSKITDNSTLFKTSTVKPTMLLASYTSINGTNIIDPTKLTPGTTDMDTYLSGIRNTIDKGIGADFKNYTGTAYYLKTTDSARNVRYTDQQKAATSYQNYLNSQYLEQNSLGGKSDILIYQTGLANLDPTESGANTYLDGAIADTLTSYSGGLYDSGGQISILSYLKAGVTASYGTVREPCNYTAKFPQASVLVQHLIAGDSIIEAYYKSVQWPTEGLFIGEPLARPYTRIVATIKDGQVYLKNIGGIDGKYNVIYNGQTIATNISLHQSDSNPNNIGVVNYDGTNNLLQLVLQ